LDLLGPGLEGLVVAVSGGPDSVALIHALATLQTPGVTLRLIVAHLNHQLRGAESDADETFVTDLCASLGTMTPHRLDGHSTRINVAETARAERGNLESTARRLRYAWLAQVAVHERVPFIATGHTADDQAETVLHRLLRGTGLRGLRGIARRRHLEPGVEVVRPLLRVTRAEVLAYLESVGQSFRHDCSNQEMRFTRNRIRHELLPYLANQYNPGIVSVLGRLAESADDAFRVQEAAAAALLAQVELPPAGAVLVLNRTRLANAPPSLIRETFRFLWHREGWPTNGMTFDAWERLADLAAGKVNALDLPAGIRVRASERTVQVSRHTQVEVR
jgi:tRNA(Ile)-lysidine synthase